MFDNNNDREYSTDKEETELEKFKRLVSYQKRGKPVNRRNYQKIVINNGTVNKKVLADLPIPEGWERGRIKKGVQK